MNFGAEHTSETSPLAAALCPTESTSEHALLPAQPEFWEQPEAESNSTGLLTVSDARLDIGSLVRDVESILQGADEDQADLTWRYIEAGRRLWEIGRAHREGKKRRAAVMKHAHHRGKRRFRSIKPADQETFDQLLDRSFPNRERSTLREYMTLAKEFDAADEATKVQLTGLFRHGWGPVLNEIRRRKRLKGRRNGQPAKGDCDCPDLRILLGDCMVRLRELPDESVDCVVTSVPYFQCRIFPGATTVFGGDRHCVHDWQMRQFPSRHYINAPHVVESGTCRRCAAQLVMLGWEDTLAEYVRHLVEVLNEVKRVLKATGVFWLNIADRFSDKELLLVPHRLSIALADSGWMCRQEVIWAITNRAPESTTNRPYRNHEHVFMFVKQKDHYFDIDGMRERSVSPVKPAQVRRV